MAFMRSASRLLGQQYHGSDRLLAACSALEGKSATLVLVPRHHCIHCVFDSPNGAGAMSRPVGLFQPVSTAQRLQHSDMILARLLPAEAAFCGGVSCTSADSLVVAMLRKQGQAQHQPATPFHHQSSVCSQHSSWCVSDSAALPGALREDVLQLDSVRRKRASKMNKHKHKKRRRRDRASRK